MQALYENKIYPEVYAGTSAGSIVASTLACGYKPERALEEFESISKEMIDIAYGYILKGIFTKSPIEGFIKGDALEKKLEELFKGSRIGKVYAPLGIVATDINQAKQVVFSNVEGDLSKVNDDRVEWFSSKSRDVFLHEAVRASSSMPPAFVPKFIDDMKLVDGGVTNNLPSDIAKALGADKVISIDLGYSGQVKTEGIIDIAHESINILMARIVDENRQNFGLYLNPEVYDVSALEVSKIQECFDRGYKYGVSQIDNIVKYLEE
jgi:NTE family protein